jgi:hypothetical protein
MSADRAELATRERVALRCRLPLEEGSGGTYALSALEIHVGPETLVAAEPIPSTGAGIDVIVNREYYVFLQGQAGFRNGVPLDLIFFDLFL